MSKQRYLTERIRLLKSHDLHQRLFEFLKEQYGTREHITTGISKKDMAAAIGMVPATFSRLLLRLKREGTLVWSGQDMNIRKGFWDTFRAG